MPNKNFLFLSKEIDYGGKRLGARQILDTLLQRGVWYMTPGATNRKRLEAGDRILFYLGGRTGFRQFVGQGICGGSAEPVSKEDEQFLEDWGAPFFEWRVGLQDVQVWKQGVPIKPLVPGLTFIKDKQNYGLNLRLGIVEIPDHDYDCIIRRSQAEVMA